MTPETDFRPNSYILKVFKSFGGGRANAPPPHHHVDVDIKLGKDSSSPSSVAHT